MLAKKLAVGACAVVLAAAGGIAVAQGDGSSVAKSSTAAAQGGPGGPGGPGAHDLSGLAKDLGVPTAKLQKAMEAARPAGPSAGGPDAMAATLAKRLGLPAATVRKALSANAPSGAPPSGGTPPTGGIVQDES